MSPTSPSRPMELPFPGKMGRHSTVKLRAVFVDGPMKSFSVQFLTVDGIAMQILVPAVGDVAFNSLKATTWEMEERHHNPLRVGREFEIKIKNKGEYMQIKANGSNVAHFFHRDVPSKIRAVALSGDISVRDVRFKHFKGRSSREEPVLVFHSNPPPHPQPMSVMVPHQMSSTAVSIQTAPGTMALVPPPPQAYIDPPPYPEDEFPQSMAIKM